MGVLETNGSEGSLMGGQFSVTKAIKPERKVGKKKVRCVFFKRRSVHCLCISSTSHISVSLLLPLSLKNNLFYKIYISLCFLLVHLCDLI